MLEFNPAQQTLQNTNCSLMKSLEFQH